MQTEDLHYGKLANIYDGFLALTGFKRGFEAFFDRVELNLAPNARILDAGCGTGLASFYLARRFPNAHVTAFDIDQKMLEEMAKIGVRDGIPENQVTIREGDLAHPNRLKALSGEVSIIPEKHFDAVIASGALEHVPLHESVAALVRLLKPGGVFFNLSVRRNPAGAVLGMLYNFRPYKVSEMRTAFAKAGLADIRVLRLTIDAFPVNLSRIAYIARKES